MTKIKTQTQIETPAFTLIGGSEAGPCYELEVTRRELRAAKVGAKWDADWKARDTYASYTSYAQLVYKDDNGVAVLHWDEPYVNAGHEAPHDNLQLVWYGE